MPTEHIDMGNNVFVTSRYERGGYDIVKDENGGWFIEEKDGDETRRSITYAASNKADSVIKQSIIEWLDDWEIISSLYEDLGHDEDTIEHIKRVRVLCRRFIHAGLDVDDDLLLFSAGLHDVAKELAGNKHHKKEKIKEALKEAGVRKKRRKAFNESGVYEIISAHKKDFCPEDHQMKAAILRICDKLDKFDKAKDKKNPTKKAIKAMSACNKTMEKIYEDFDYEDNLDEFDDFYQVYLTILQQQIKSFNEFLKHIR